MNLKVRLLNILWLSVGLPALMLCLPQAIYVKRHTIRLPEATGQRINQLNSDASISILHIGESTVAGVGVDEIEQGLTANIANRLSSAFRQPVGWAVIAENGIKIKDLHQKLADQHYQPNAFNFSIITMGVNDTTKFTTLKTWQASIISTIELISKKTDGPIFFTQVPPLSKFPSLPAPLKYLLGFRAHILDTLLQSICWQFDHVHYIRSEVQVDKQMMAIDGYHPSQLGYENWSEQVAKGIVDARLNTNT